LIDFIVASGILGVQAYCGCNHSLQGKCHMLEFHLSMAEDLILENGDSLDDDMHGRHILEAARAYLKLTENPERQRVPCDVLIERREDMGTGRIQLIREEDGDMCLSVISDDGGFAGVQFCTSVVGGGRSPKVLKALYQLAQAMLEENQEHPLPQ